jgi:hypothetical protein
MANAMVALANLTLGSNQSTVTFSSIPATYRDLRLVVQAINGSTTNGFRITLNADTGANYSQVVMYGTGSSAISNTDGTNYFYLNDFIAASTTEYTLSTVDVMDYSTTDKHKAILERGNRAGAQVTASAGRYASTSAITSLQVNTGGGSLGAGSTFALYGIVS